VDRNAPERWSEAAVVKRAIETREVITLDAGGIHLQGTYHRCEGDLPDSPQGRNQNSRIGVLFVNSGFLPRAADGNSAVYWADSFAKCGYPSFRFDLPGLGDSEGDLPVRMLEFVHLVNAGRYAPLLSTAAKNLTKRFNLLGVVVVGLCAGAVSAIYTAAASTEVKGLVLLDPYFHLQQASTNGLSLPTHMRNLFDRLRYLGLLLLGKKLPRNANLPLIRCWNQLVSAGVPMLVLTPSAPKVKAGEFDYLHHPTAQHSRRIIVKHIERTNHSFVKGPGKEAVRTHTEQWLGTWFPSVKNASNVHLKTRVAINA
jgi:pimeloyl-ACP methyl ester carboxylesterase